jgi:hypothetical protein
MALPPSLLQQIEQHGCFSGCYGSELEARVCLDPVQALELVVVVSCLDCLNFKVGVRRGLLPAGSSSFTLANQLTQHVRGQRGYGLSFSGYHARGPGFWLAAAYYARGGLFLLDGSRSRALGSDLDLLLLAFKHGVAQLPHPQMLDARLYATQTVYVNYATPPAPFANRQALLAAPQCLQQPKTGYQRVTLAEFQPVARQAPAPAAPASGGTKPAPTPAARSLKPGDVCPVCHGEVCERPLLNGTYVGCLC